MLEFLKDSSLKELKWKCLIRLIFSNRLTTREKEKILETFTLTIVAILIVAPIVVQATPTLVTIIDQKENIITNLVKTSVVGCSVRAYNSSHFILEMEEPCILKVYLYNITVWQGSLKPNNSYVVKASVVEMKIKSPSRDISITVRLVGLDKEWQLYGEKEYTIYPVPAATYNISLPGKSFSIYYNGGELRVVKDFVTSPNLPLLALAVIPLASYGGYKAFKQRESPLLVKYRLRKKRRKPKPMSKHPIKHFSKHVIKPEEEQFEKPKKKHKWKQVNDITKGIIEAIADVLEQSNDS